MLIPEEGHGVQGSYFCFYEFIAGVLPLIPIDAVEMVIEIHIQNFPQVICLALVEITHITKNTQSIYQRIVFHLGLRCRMCSSIPIATAETQCGKKNSGKDAYNYFHNRPTARFTRAVGGRVEPVVIFSWV